MNLILNLPFELGIHSYSQSELEEWSAITIWVNSKNVKRKNNLNRIIVVLLNILTSVKIAA